MKTVSPGDSARIQSAQRRLDKGFRRFDAYLSGLLGYHGAPAWEARPAWNRRALADLLADMRTRMPAVSLPGVPL